MKKIYGEKRIWMTRTNENYAKKGSRMLMRVMSVKTKVLSENATKGKKLMHKVKETGNNFGGNKHHWERIVLNKRWSCRLRKAWHNF